MVVVTAANRAQAEGYRAQLAGRGRFLVIPDPGDRRVGSLGATVNALRMIARRSKGGARPRRVLVCHSGGDAKRTPAYAAMGKAFVPMPDGRPMLDHIVDEMEKLPARPGVTVCCGDVIPYLDGAKVKFAARGVTGVAYPDGPGQAKRHGVYVVDGGSAFAKASADKSGNGVLLPVADFLQKPSVSRGKFLIDTGIMFFGWDVAAKMSGLPVAGDIYEDFPRLLKDGFAAFSVAVVPKCRFFHIGSSRELLALLGRRGVLVDGCRAPLKRLGGRNVVTNVPREYGAVSLGRGECLTSLPLKDGGWYHLRYRIDDTFKEDGLWEKHGLGEKMKNVDHRRLLELRRNEVVVEKPLRIDLAGGWSDTPPICNLVGGCVLNAAVTLNGAKPVKAVVRPVNAREVRVASVDLGRSGVIKSMREIRAPKDPHDWCALVKSALAVVGYDFSWGGVDIRISADVPKGSGMGTSSILGAALVEALLVFHGDAADWSTVASKTLDLEREMQTGGGWEDQLGALVPGVKLIETAAGEKQDFRVKRLPPKAEAAFAKFLAERGLLYFTGQKRMARSVLRGVLKFYRENPDNIAHEIIDRVKEEATSAYRALLRYDYNAYCAAMNGYWLSKKALDPGSTNQHVESIIARMAPWTQAVSLCGAGGGGFMFVVARSVQAKEKILRVFSGGRRFAAGRFYDFDIMV